jgi:GDPmannose 4,6-dehydratase
LLLGDPTKALTQLGWVPEYDLASLVREMVNSDLNLIGTSN